MSITGAEAFYLARRIRGGAGARAVAAETEARAGIPHLDWAKRTSPCALLRDNACSVYDARPINCRRVVSTSLDACKRAYVEMTGEAVPVPGIFRGMGFIVQTALAAALVKRGLPTLAYELSGAVNRAVSHPELEAERLQGRDVFAGLQRDTVDPGGGGKRQGRHGGGIRRAMIGTWQTWALLSAAFAALTAIFAKIGVENVNSVVFLGERLSGANWLGVALIAAGAILVAVKF